MEFNDNAAEICRIILPFSISNYWANPVIVHHTLLRLWGCDSLYILYLHHFFLKHTERYWWVSHDHVLCSSRIPRLTISNKCNEKIPWKLSMQVNNISTQDCVVRFVVIPLICLHSPCEWRVAFAETGPWLGSQSPLCCEMLQKKREDLRFYKTCLLQKEKCSPWT